jgi:hypothetical protein
VAGPVITLGWAGTAEAVTANVLAVPFPQAFDGTTEMFPEPVPTVTEMELVTPPPVCVQPAGNVHA